MAWGCSRAVTDTGEGPAEQRCVYPLTKTVEAGGQKLVMTTMIDYFVTGSAVEAVASAEMIVHARVTRALGTWNMERDVFDRRREGPKISPGTDYEVQVAQYLRGIDWRRTITVTHPGGTYKGCTAPSTSDPPVLGGEYVLFLRRIPIGDRYGLSALPGHWRVENGQAIPAQVRVGTSPAAPVSLDDLKALVRKHPARQ